MATQERQSSTAMLIVVWLIVGLPGAWGVGQTLYKSLDLFRTPALPAPTTVSQPATQPK